LHYYVAERFAEVQALASSRAWLLYYRRSRPRDALWRFRCVPVWRPAAICSQACSLLAWAWLIFPHCDAVLIVGVLANLLHLLWRLSRLALRCCGRRRRRGPVARWFEELEEAGSSEGEEEEEEEEHEDEASGSPEKVGPARTPRREVGPARTPRKEDGPTRSSPRREDLHSASSSCKWRRSSSRSGRSSTPRPRPLPPAPLEESEEEAKQRALIEEMRRSQERRAAVAW